MVPFDTNQVAFLIQVSPARGSVVIVLADCQGDADFQWYNGTKKSCAVIITTKVEQNVKHKIFPRVPCPYPQRIPFTMKKHRIA